MPTMLSWEAFEASLLTPGVPLELRLDERVRATIFVTERGNTIGLRIPAPRADGRLKSPLRQLKVSVLEHGGRTVIELSTASREIFREFFLFAMDVVATLPVDGGEVLAAVEEALGAWRKLLQRAARLSREAEIGLFGELLCLERLIGDAGGAALDAWVGPLGQRHDFRLRRIDLEVKTTTAGHRDHFINGWEQLLPSGTTPLHLLSTQLEAAGEGPGRSLPELIAQLRTSLPAGARSRFDALLDQSGFVSSDAALYADRFRRRAPDRLIRVDASFPRIVPGNVTLRPKLRALIPELHYRVCVDGFGDELALAAVPSSKPVRSRR